MAVTYTSTASFQTPGTLTTNAAYKDVTVTVADGDLIVAFGCSENANGSGTAALATQLGSTGSWTISASNNTNQTPGYVMGYAQASAGGSVTVRITVPTTNGSAQMGGGIWVIPAGQWSGTPAVTTFGTHDADGKVSVTVGATSTVLFGGADWTALDPGTSVTPAGSADSVWSDDVHYAGMLAEWVGQAPGTRNYGPVSPAGDDWSGAVLVIQGDASGGGGGTPQTTADLWASGTPTTGQSNGSWSGATNATGANDGVRAQWTSTGSGATGYIIPAGFGAQAAIGSAPASVDSVSVTVYGYVTNTTRMSSIAVQLTDAGTVFGTAQTMTKSTTTTFSQTFTFTGVTWAQLANLGVRVLFTRGAVTTAANGLVDAVKIAVTYTPASLTPVSTTRSTTWVTRKNESTTRATTWAVAENLTPVSTTRASTWTTRKNESTTRASTWTTRRVESTTRASTWTTRAAVTPVTRASTWTTRAAVTPVTRTTSWNTRAGVALSRATTWNVFGLTAVQRTWSSSWAVLSGVTPVTRATTWNLRAAVTPVTRATTWTTRAAVAPVTRSTTWITRQNLSTTRTATWVALAGVTPVTRAASWRVLFALSRVWQTTWQVNGNLAPVSRAWSTTWDTEAYLQVSTTRTATWVVLAGVTPVTRVASWSTLFALSRAQQTTWRVYQGVALTRSSGWETRATVAAARAAVWATLEALTPRTWTTSWAVAAPSFGPHVQGSLVSTGPDGRLMGGTRGVPLDRGVAAGRLGRGTRTPGLRRGG